ncbi:MAG: hypothetical protein ABIP74_03390 [Candidatus Saccharimonas sp.]
MNKRRELVRDFARTYLHINLRTLAGVPHEIHELVKDLQTVIVDTIHLSNGTQTLIETWVLPGTAGAPKHTAHRATATSLQPLPRGLRLATAPSRAPVQPADSGSGGVEWSAWHHGDVYELTVAGSVEEVLMYCETTDNERERIIMQARKLSQSDYIVYATARGLSKDARPTHGALAFDGLVVCRLHLLPGTIDAISRLKQRGVRIIYMTAAPEDLATYVAQTAHITDQPKIARHGRYASNHEHAIYARVSRINARKITAALPQPHIVALHPLPELVAMLDACR